MEVREQEQVDFDQHREALRTIRRAQIPFFVLYLAFAPVMIGLWHWAGKHVEFVMMGFVVYSLGVVGANFYIMGQRCPRCHNLFFFRWMPNLGVLGHRCVHCRLSLVPPKKQRRGHTADK